MKSLENYECEGQLEFQEDKTVKGYIEVWYEGELIQHWISNDEYQAAYETNYNL